MQKLAERALRLTPAWRAEPLWRALPGPTIRASARGGAVSRYATPWGWRPVRQGLPAAPIPRGVGLRVHGRRDGHLGPQARQPKAQAVPGPGPESLTNALGFPGRGLAAAAREISTRPRQDRRRAHSGEHIGYVGRRRGGVPPCAGAARGRRGGEHKLAEHGRAPCVPRADRPGRASRQAERWPHQAAHSQAASPYPDEDGHGGRRCPFSRPCVPRRRGRGADRSQQPAHRGRPARRRQGRAKRAPGLRAGCSTWCGTFAARPAPARPSTPAGASSPGVTPKRRWTRAQIRSRSTRR